MQCPICHRDNELSASAGGKPPVPGNVSFCWGCGGVGVFTVFGVRKPTPAELKEIMQLPEIQQATTARGMGGDPVDVINRLGRKKN